MKKTMHLLFLLSLLSLTGALTGKGLLQDLSLNYKNTFVIFGKGRRSERDLPVCENHEACNLAHQRLWLTPITERLCRCPRKVPCPLSYEAGLPPNSQHITNRGQLKFCEEIIDTTQECQISGENALKVVETKGKVMRDKEADTTTVRTTLLCRCPWPNALLLNQSQSLGHGKTVKTYSCCQLPRCEAHDECGVIRKDTYEVYYTCKCPKEHLCTFKEPLHAKEQNNLPLLNAETYQAECNPK